MAGLTTEQRARVEERAAVLKAQYDEDTKAGRFKDRAGIQTKYDADACEAYVIVYDDVEMNPEFYSGEGSTLVASTRFEMLKPAWSVRLYRMVAKG
jgi:hypothetical protein